MRSNRLPPRWRVLLALAMACASAACEPIPPVSTAIDVVNGEDGALVVWRHARYKGGGFNGFDNNPVLIKRATFKGVNVSESNAAPVLAPIPLDYVYDRGNGPDWPTFVRAEHGYRVAPCRSIIGLDGDCDAAARHPLVAQLGRRGDRLGLAGSNLLFYSADGQPCRRACPAEALETGARRA